MAEYTEAKKRANKKWNDANMKERYDRIQLVVPKGQKEAIQKATALSGDKSVNAFITRLINTELERLKLTGDGFGFSSVPEKADQ